MDRRDGRYGRQDLDRAWHGAGRDHVREPDSSFRRGDGGRMDERSSESMAGRTASGANKTKGGWKPVGGGQGGNALAPREAGESARGGAQDRSANRDLSFSDSRRAARSPLHTTTYEESTTAASSRGERQRRPYRSERSVSPPPMRDHRDRSRDWARDRDGDRRPSYKGPSATSQPLRSSDQDRDRDLDRRNRSRPRQGWSSRSPSPRPFRSPPSAHASGRRPYDRRPDYDRRAPPSEAAEGRRQRSYRPDERQNREDDRWTSYDRRYGGQNDRIGPGYHRPRSRSPNLPTDRYRKKSRRSPSPRDRAQGGSERPRNGRSSPMPRFESLGPRSQSRLSTRSRSPLPERRTPGYPGPRPRSEHETQNGPGANSSQPPPPPLAPLANGAPLVPERVALPAAPAVKPNPFGYSNETMNRLAKSGVSEGTLLALQPSEGGFNRITQVGEGTYGKVYKALVKESGVLVAMKRIRMESEKDGFPVTAMREIKLLQNLSHPNIVRLHEIMIGRGSVYMVFEYMDHDLTGVLSHPTFRFSHGEIKSLAHQMFQGLAYLHHNAIIHRDIKGSNILLNNLGELKLADFGLARLYEKRKSGNYTNRVITLWYRPPELLLGQTNYGPQVDIWSAGCIMLELFTRRPVFQGAHEIEQLEIIYRHLGTPSVETWPGLLDCPWYELVKPKTECHARFEDSFAKYLSDDLAATLIGKTLTYDPSQRISASDVLKDDYFYAEPAMVNPESLAELKGEWHELEAKHRKRKAKEMEAKKTAESQE